MAADGAPRTADAVGRLLPHEKLTIGRRGSAERHGRDDDPNDDDEEVENDARNSARREK